MLGLKAIRFEGLDQLRATLEGSGSHGMSRSGRIPGPRGANPACERSTGKKTSPRARAVA